MSTSLSLPNRRSGKVRDVYDLTLKDGRAGVLIVASDRISAFDVVMANGLPGKGIVLTQLSRFWFDRFANEVEHHLVSTDVADVPGLSDGERVQLDRRVMVCRRTKVIPIECVARGYLAGSGYREYAESGAVCGIRLPKGLSNGDQLPTPIFTPATKAAVGHDENVTFDAAADLAGGQLMERVRAITLKLYSAARDYALTRGIIIADTKFEFGVPLDGDGEPILIDEVLTPDSSRFWPCDGWRPGREQPSFDKQPVRDYLDGLVKSGGWNRSPPGPQLPANIVSESIARYVEAYQRLTGEQIRL